MPSPSSPSPTPPPNPSPASPSPPPLELWAQLPDPQSRLSHLVQWAKIQPTLPPSLRQDQYLIPGCLARLWWIPSLQNGQCHFAADSDSTLVKGLALVIASHFNGQSPQKILQDNSDPLAVGKIDHHITAHRRNGLNRLRESIRNYAQSCLPA